MSKKVISQIPQQVAPENTNTNDVQDNNILIRTKNNPNVHDSGIVLTGNTTFYPLFLSFSGVFHC
jgi:hypothetical protein